MQQLQRRKAEYRLAAGDAGKMKQRMLNWADQFSILCFLDNNNYPAAYNGYECLLAAGCRGQADADGDSLEALLALHSSTKDWIFGHLNYDYKNTLEPGLSSAHKASNNFPVSTFFVPQTVCFIDRELSTLTVETFDDPVEVYEAILNSKGAADELELPKLQFEQAIGRGEYLATIQRLRSHIADGDCYEINFCNEGYCRNASVNPLQVFKQLNVLSPSPFAAYYRINNQYLMCCSPERYLRKEGSRIMSQPIKGTARRGIDADTDDTIKEILRHDVKERAENVMIVDLVRNDLARACKTGSVVVDELFGIYTFPQVHQMISTVSGELKEDLPLTDAIRYSFPMGSMTGAPKYKVMQLIEQYEQSGRGLYSGTVGYITPAGDFDFNVVIRSLFYDAASKYLSYQTGGAITYDSSPEQEWDEMRLKAWALERIFS